MIGEWRRCVSVVQLIIRAGYPAKQVARLKASDVATVPRNKALTVLSESRTVGALSKTKRYADDHTPERVSKLNGKRKQLAAKWFRDADLGGRSKGELQAATDLMDARDPKGVSRMLRRMDDADQEAFLDPDMDASVRRNIYDGWKSDRLVSASDASESARKYKKMGGQNSQRLGTLMDRAAGSSVRFTADVDASTLRKTLSNKDISNDELTSTTKKYSKLEAGQQRQFLELLEDDGVRTSLVKTVGAPEVDTLEVEQALLRVEDMKESNHKTLEFHRTKQLNRQAKEEGYKPQHEGGSIAVDFEMNGEKTLYRLEQDGDELGGRWLIDKRALESADTRKELIDKMGLLPDEWGVNYDTVVKLDTSTVETPSKLRVSTAGEMESSAGVTRKGGVRQYQRIIQNDADSINGWSRDGPITNYVEIEG